MPRLNEEELKSLSDQFEYKALLERYKVLERIFDIKEGSTIIDGGAFHGDMSLYFSKKVGKKGRVFAFEPLPTNSAILWEFIDSKRLTNVTVVPVALWNRNEKIPFYLSDYPNAGSPLKEFRKVMEKNILVRGVRLDDILYTYGVDKVDYIWLNIEGSELNALDGMRGTLYQNNCKICVSTHKITEEYTNTNDVLKKLESFGYDARPLEDHPQWIYGEKKWAGN